MASTPAQMNEAEAWRATARFFVGARHTKSTRRRLDDYYHLAGLCSVIRHFTRVGDIRHAMANRMIDTLRRDQCIEEDTFVWPVNAAGHRKRVAFCRRMALRT